jgi:hypothetical protein
MTMPKTNIPARARRRSARMFAAGPCDGSDAVTG